MRFILIDKVISLQAGKEIKAIKGVSLAEEYLADHFPTFPVLPGVLMIEALVQTAAMLVRVTNDFRQSMIVLVEARNVKYKSFVKPGNTLTLKVEAKSITDESSSFTGTAYIGEQTMVEARLKLRHYNLADEAKDMAGVDAKIIEEMKGRAQLVGALKTEAVRR